MDKDRKDEGDEEEEPRRFRFDPEASQRMIEEAFARDHQLTEMQMAIARRVLGDHELFCSACGGFCHHQTILLRDLFMRRGFDLALEITGLFDLYFRERKAGLEEPFQLIARLYQRWSELGYVYDMAEPQERLVETAPSLGFVAPEEEDEDDGTEAG